MNNKKDKYSLTVYGDPLEFLPNYKNVVKTCVFKSSYCKTNIVVFDNEQDLIKAKEYYKQKKGA